MLKEEQAQLVKTEALSRKTEKPKDRMIRMRNRTRMKYKKKASTKKSSKLFFCGDPNERYFELFGGGFGKFISDLNQYRY